VDFQVLHRFAAHEREVKDDDARGAVFPRRQTNLACGQVEDQVGVLLAWQAYGAVVFLEGAAGDIQPDVRPLSGRYVDFFAAGQRRGEGLRATPEVIVIYIQRRTERVVGFIEIDAIESGLGAGGEVGYDDAPSAVVDDVLDDLASFAVGAVFRNRDRGHQRRVSELATEGKDNVGVFQQAREVARRPLKAGGRNCGKGTDLEFLQVSND